MSHRRELFIASQLLICESQRGSPAGESRYGRMESRKWVANGEDPRERGLGRESIGVEWEVRRVDIGGVPLLQNFLRTSSNKYHLC